jgi:hypothetical protein
VLACIIDARTAAGRERPELFGAPGPGRISAYAASKHAAHGLTRPAAQEYAGVGGPATPKHGQPGHLWRRPGVTDLACGNLAAGAEVARSRRLAASLCFPVPGFRCQLESARADGGEQALPGTRYGFGTARSAQSRCEGGVPAAGCAIR